MKMHESIVIALIALFGAVVGGMVSPIVDAFIRARVVNDRLVELAIDILKSDCKTAPGLVPARPWAVDVIQKLSPVHLSEEARAALLHNSIAPGAFSRDFNSDFERSATIDAINSAYCAFARRPSLVSA
jgi:hypothetical protein